jgi:peptidoglycan/xylan/chitin deacetylase (PgdA/CDA1 family)
MSWVDAVARLIDATGAPRLLPARGPLLVMYHGLGGEDGVAPDAFERQLDLLRARRRVVPLQEAVAALGRPEAAELAAITFDDGYRDFAELAVPRLTARGLHATVFVPAAVLGKHNAWDEGRAARREILSAAALRALDPASVGIGAHGATHVRLAGLAARHPAALDRETAGARKTLEDALGREVRHFAYPYGQLDDFDPASERAVAAAGFAAACSTHFGRGSRPDERYRLRRVGIEPSDLLEVVARKLDGAYDFCAVKERLGARVRRAGA